MKKQDEFPLNRYPQLIEEWHPQKNQSLSKEEITLGSSRKVWWKCPKGEAHEWEASVCDRVNRGRGCPFCSGRRVTKDKSLGVLKPDIAKHWHPTKNKNVTPFDVSPFSSKKAWWLCLEGVGHEWEAVIGAKTAGNGCPFCSGRKVTFEDSILSRYPELANQIDKVKNFNIDPLHVSPNHRKPIWWLCDQSHSYEASPFTRCKQFEEGSKNSCPECNGLKAAYPNLAGQWHQTKNLPQKAETISTGSNFKAVWVCDSNSSHEWEQTVKSRVMALKRNVTRGSECPICLNRKATKENCLLSTHPALIKEWDYERNAQQELFPDQITLNSKSKAFWICIDNPSHRWDAIVCDRAGTYREKGSGCPFCINRKVQSSNSLAIAYPQMVAEWHPTKNGSLTPFDVSPGSDKKAFWLCSKDPTHEWEAHIYSRTGAGERGCPYCSRWTIDRMRLFVKSLVNHIPNFTPAELLVLFERSGVLNSNGQAKAIAKAIQNRKLTKDELVGFSEGTSSKVEDMLSEALSKPDLEQEENHAASTPFEKASSDEIDPLNILPNIQARAALEALDKAASIVTDEDAIQFFVASAKLKSWQHASIDESEAVQQIKNFHGDTYSEEVKSAFLEEYEGANNLILPSIADQSITPNLMQRLICFKMLKEKRFGNWSGTGAGKTFSAIIASKLIGAKVTVIICPNNVIPEWEKTIPRAFPHAKIIVKESLHPTSVDFGAPVYLILNYEYFQQPLCRHELQNLIDTYQIDFCILDEVHFTKQREKNKMSIRKNNIFWFTQKIGEKNSDLHILGMSATPVINNIYEGKTLLELITGQSFDGIETKNTMQNCMALYQMLTRYGVRIKPKYTASLAIRCVEVECSQAIPEIKQIGKRDILGLETSLMKVKLPLILKEVTKKTLIYCHYVDYIVEMLKKAIIEAGYTVAIFSGQEKESLDKFIKGDIDILIASRCISTGVDGLQKVCSRVIVASLPWTGAEFEQLCGRIHRQGQTQNQVEIIIPITFIESHGERRSWCQMRYERIKYKKTIADAAVDGVIPDEHIRTSEQAFEDHMTWVKRLDA
ncbi:MAG: DEAD/DEAH box helicase family protein [Rhabdochlamydiaceae bacterium]|nr:DEAD/DEAH box helicase family protein [Rhabdochlamydiaceae bacterium]